VSRHLFPLGLQSSSLPPTFTWPIVCSQRSSTGSGPAFGATANVSVPAENHLPLAASNVRGRETPPTTAVREAPSSPTGSFVPKSTTALTPTVQLAVAAVKYASAHEPAKSRTSRAIGGLGCAPLPADDQPRTYTMPFALSAS